MARRQVGAAPTSTDEAATRGSVAAQITAAMKYRPAVLILEANQSNADVPADFPAGGIIFQKSA